MGRGVTKMTRLETEVPREPHISNFFVSRLIVAIVESIAVTIWETAIKMAKKGQKKLRR